MADLYSKVTLRPRSKLERVLDLLQPGTTVPKRPESGVLVQLVLYYLIAAELSPADASRIVKQLQRTPNVGGSAPLEFESLLNPDPAVFASIPEKHRSDLMGAIRAVGQAAMDGLEDVVKNEIDEAKRQILALPRMSEKSADLVLLTCGAASTVAPSAAARRVASRLGYPGSTYAALARALDAEVPEGDSKEIAWRAHHVLAQHGKDVCHLTNPSCHQCSLFASCSYRGQGTDPARAVSNSGG